MPKENLEETDTSLHISEESLGTENDCDMSEEKSQTESEVTQEDSFRAAELFKEEGNELYKNKKYIEATQCYTQAIDICPNIPAFYGNRAAAYIMIHKYSAALDDARLSTTIDPSFTKGHIREAKCLLLMGEALAAKNKYEMIVERDPTNNLVKQELQQAEALLQYMKVANESFSKGDYRKVVWCMDRSVDISPGCRRFYITKAECLALLGRYVESQDLASDILHQDSMNADALYVRGMCLYYEDNIDKAFQHFQQALRLAPDHAKARKVYANAKLLKSRKEEGNAAFRSGRYKEANDLYTQALAIDPHNKVTNSKLYFNRATVNSKLCKPQEAIDDCSQALKLDPNYLKAYLRRAKCYAELEKYEECVKDYETVCKMDKSREHQRLLRNAKLELKKSQRKDYYRILGLSKEACEDDIKKAYKKRAMLHHPDRHPNVSESERQLEMKKFQEVGEAYKILSDPKKKASYDSGKDLEDMDTGFSDFDPNTLFHQFFAGTGGAGTPFNSTGSFYSQGGHTTSANFPGSFNFQFG